MVLAIVQARMGSTRLPGKSMMPLNGKPALAWVLHRLSLCRRLDGIAVATTDEPLDDPIEALCRELGVYCFRGSPQDVLDRYYRCAQAFTGPSADTIVRVTGDCPVIDPQVVDACVAIYQSQDNKRVYASNCIERTYPDGLDVEVFSRESLEEAWHKARMASEREHVTVYIRENNPAVELKHPTADYSSLRLTLDYAEDAVVIDALLRELADADGNFGLEQMVTYLENHPDIRNLNAHFDPNEGLKKSLREDRIVNP